MRRLKWGREIISIYSSFKIKYQNLIFVIFSQSHHSCSFFLRLGYGWQSVDENSPFPKQHAIRAGRDSDGHIIYVGRAFHENDLLPAKVIPDKQMAFGNSYWIWIQYLLIFIFYSFVFSII